MMSSDPPESYWSEVRRLLREKHGWSDDAAGSEIGNYQMFLRRYGLMEFIGKVPEKETALGIDRLDGQILKRGEGS